MILPRIATKEKSKKYWGKLFESIELYLVSMPLFNLKKDMQFSSWLYCGIYCAEGGTYIYKLNENGNGNCI
jgi:hypothetical protein